MEAPSTTPLNTFKIYHNKVISKVLKREFRAARIEGDHQAVTFGGWLRERFDVDVTIDSTSINWIHDYTITFKDYKQKLLFEIKYGEYLT